MAKNKTCKRCIPEKFQSFARDAKNKLSPQEPRPLLRTYLGIYFHKDLEECRVSLQACSMPTSELAVEQGEGVTEGVQNLQIVFHEGKREARSR